MMMKQTEYLWLDDPTDRNRNWIKEGSSDAMLEFYPYMAHSPLVHHDPQYHEKFRERRERFLMVHKLQKQDRSYTNKERKEIDKYYQYPISVPPLTDFDISNGHSYPINDFKIEIKDNGLIHLCIEQRHNVKSIARIIMDKTAFRRLKEELDRLDVWSSLLE